MLPLPDPSQTQAAAAPDTARRACRAARAAPETRLHTAAPGTAVRARAEPPRPPGTQAGASLWSAPAVPRHRASETEAEGVGVVRELLLNPLRPELPGRVCGPMSEPRAWF